MGGEGKDVANHYAFGVHEKLVFAPANLPGRHEQGIGDLCSAQIFKRQIFVPFFENGYWLVRVAFSHQRFGNVSSAFESFEFISIRGPGTPSGRSTSLGSCRTITCLPSLACRNRRLNPGPLARPPATVTHRRRSHHRITPLDGTAGQRARHAKGWLWDAPGCNRS